MKSLHSVTLSAALFAAMITTTDVFAQGRSGGAGGGGGGRAGGGPSAGPSQNGAPAQDRFQQDHFPSQAGPSERANRGLETASAQGAPAAAALDMAATMRAINTASFESRREVLETMDMSVEASRDELRQIQRDAKNLRGDARDTFNAAVEDADVQRKALDESRKALRKAKAAGWEEHKKDVSEHLEKYAAALERAKSLSRSPSKP